MGGEAISSIFNHKGNSQSHVAAELDAHVGKLFALQETALGERSLAGSTHSQSTDQRKNMEGDHNFLLFTPQSSSRQLLATLLSSWPRMVPEAGGTIRQLKSYKDKCYLLLFVLGDRTDPLEQVSLKYKAGKVLDQKRLWNWSQEWAEKELSKQTPRSGVWQKGIAVGDGV